MIPILGAVPDGMMILMSGIRGATREETQEELNVGVGTLAGSTIMLLTVPWAVGVYLNRRVIGGPEQRALTIRKHRVKKVLNRLTGRFEDREVPVDVPIVPKTFSWTQAGATALSTTSKGAIAMMITALSYFIIQLPAFGASSDLEEAAQREKWFALVGFIVTLVLFFSYLYWQYQDSDAAELVVEKQRRLHEKWLVTDALSNIKAVHNVDPFADPERTFELFDTDKNGSIDFDEMVAGWKTIGYDFDDTQAHVSFNLLDADGDKKISKPEFINWIEDYLLPNYIANSDLTTQTLVPADQLPQGQAPTSLSEGVRAQLNDFLNDKSKKSISFFASRQERYLIHLWAAAQTAEVFSTHSTDVASSSAAPGDRLLRIVRGADGSDVSTLRPPRRPYKQGVPVWCSVSYELETFYHNLMDQRRFSQTTPLNSEFADTDSAESPVFVQLFHEVDTTGSGMVSLEQFLRFVKNFNVPLTTSQAKFQFYSRDQDLDHKLTRAEFKSLLESLVDTSSFAFRSSAEPVVEQSSNANAVISFEAEHKSSDLAAGGPEEENDDDDDEEEDEEAGHSMTSSEKLRWALIYILGGTALVTIFSDPMCEVIGALGDKVGIPPFYISFVVTPLASNASEVISSLKFAAKRTDVTMGLTLSALYGAATMNNTFCLSIFMGLVYFRGLAWTYTAEVMGILLVTVIVGINGLRQTIRLWQAALVALMFPLSIAFIWAMNKVTNK